ncbi:hypothetical protein SEVIR_9G374100v4 [Setaria viridis]|uniref:Transcription factor MYB1 n=2 Tax=Setaria TaxID=4554 RepID=K4AJ41_SETIT|nr:myb-related protein 308 [Setaria italica]XP_034571150.1 transcription factor MYB1-like [Setaria viridis]RCV44376.1 hypothetical protein SETIT_9G368500v2 [Setaria italica]TKV95605.1 hypothetical protein SEVIR_9G374100v2 [Setaria viridis]
MGRKPSCSKEGMNRGAWTAMEDGILVSYIQKHGEGKWGSLPRRAGLKRCGKSCRLRWLNYLRPGIKRGNISEDEEELIIRLHRLLGNRWSLIAGRLPGRTDNEIKNYWNTTLGKKVLRNSGRSKEDNQAAPEQEASPVAVRSKALRCTARLPVVQVQPAAPASHGCPSETAVGDDGVREEQAADEAAPAPAVEVQQKQLDFLPEDELSIDLDFDMGELGFLSPWRGEVGGGVGPGDRFDGDEVDDLEALLLGPGGDGNLHEFAWF